MGEDSELKYGRIVLAIPTVIAMVTAIITFIIVIAIAITHSNTLNNLQAEIALSRAELNVTATDLQAQITNLSDKTTAEMLASMVAFQAQINRAAQDLTSLADKTAAEMNASVIDFQVQINQAAANLNTTASGLQDEINALSRPVNFYENCTQERASCSFGGPGLVDTYFLGCITDQSIPINVDGYYTVDIRCEYTSNAGFFVSTHLQGSSTNVFCFCDVISPQISAPQLQLLPSGSNPISSTCTLVVDRCPLS